MTLITSVKRYKHFPSVLCEKISTKGRLQQLTAIVGSKAHAHMDRLQFHPALLARYLLDGSLSPAALTNRPEMIIAGMHGAEDPLAFAVMAGKCIQSMGAISEGITEAFIITARDRGVADSLLDSACGKIRSPWRMKGLWSPSDSLTKEINQLRTDCAGTPSVNFSDYIESGACETEKQFDQVEQLEDEDKWQYFKLRTNPDERVGAEPMQFSTTLFSSATPGLAYNLLILAAAGLAKRTCFPGDTYEELSQILQSDPIWAAEFFFAKGSNAVSDLTIWIDDIEFQSVANLQVREELAIPFQQFVAQYHALVS